jgi:hypothetical protein
MALPTFIGIGVPRGGTTWLHTWLASHPDVFMPTHRKEIRFFDRHYDKGVSWYEDFFRPAEESGRFQAIGEISPQYLYCQECPERIRSTLPDVRLLLMLRHPVDRAYSNYGFTVQRSRYRGSFEDFVASRPSSLERGFYSRYVSNFLPYFDTGRILGIVSEEIFAGLEEARIRVADFLGVSAERFPEDGVDRKVNPSTVPSSRTLSGLTVIVGRRLRRWGLEPVVDATRRLGAQRVIARGAPLPALDPDLRKKLSLQFEKEFEELEACLDVDLSRWKA